MVVVVVVGISISSSVFAGLTITVVCHTQRDRCTGTETVERVTFVATGRVHEVHAMRPNNKSG